MILRHFLHPGYETFWHCVHLGEVCFAVAGKQFWRVTRNLGRRVALQARALGGWGTWWWNAD